MSQSPVIFLVDLPEQEAELGKTLSRSGFTPRFIGSDQVGLGLTEVIPQAMIAPHLKAEEIAAALRAIDLDVEIPFFVMAPESAGTHVKGSMPREVTAVVRDDIDPGILSLRLKAATQQLPTRRGHSPTLMGFVPPQASKPSTSASIPAAPFSSPPVAPSTPPAAAPLGSVPPATPLGSIPAAARLGSVPPATPLGSVPPSPSVAPTAGQHVPSVSSTSTPPPAGLQTLATDPLATNSAAEVRAASTLPAPPSTPPAAVSTPPEAAAIPIAAAATIPPEAVAMPPAQFVTNEAITSASQSVAPASVRSVAPAANLETDIDYNQGSSNSRGKKIAFAAAALVILGGGAALLLRGADEAAVSKTPTPVAAVPPSEATPPAANVEPKVAAAAPAPVAEDVQQAEAPNELYKISGATTLDDCDKVLDKPEAYYKKQATWRGAQAWKSARTYLLQGKNELAFAQMCQSALIEPSGQAIPGLVNYFLRARAIDQAHAWAEKGVAASKSGRSAKEALGDVLSQQGKVDEARKLWLETAKLTEDKTARIEAVARNWVKSAKQSRRGGDLALAERLLRRAAAFDSNNPEVALLLAQTLSKNDQPELAKNWAKKALELDPKAEGVQEIIDGK